MKNIEKCIEQLKEKFKDRLISVFIFGSKANDKSAKNDINLMIIVKNLSPHDLAEVFKTCANWMKSGNPAPVFMDENEWFNSSDIYAMEYSDIKENHFILYGEDLISPININFGDLRFQCETETKNLLMRVRQNYLTNFDKPHKLKELFIPAAKTANTILRAVLRLNNRKISENLVKDASKVAEIDLDVFEKLNLYKQKLLKFNNQEIYCVSQNLIETLKDLLYYINNIKREK